jgi:tRNA (mo5U34)-methyltransferase
MVAPSPRIELLRRDPQVTVDEFLAHAPPGSDAPVDSDDEAIAQERWYHTIEFPDGTSTSGRLDHRPLVPHYGLPDSMIGLRALDVGTADGFWAFEMERRGAEVVAVELPALSERDFPYQAKRLVREQADAAPGRRFELARTRLRSRARLVRSTIYDISPSSFGTFDFVHVGDVLLHVRDQPAALAAIRSVTGGQAHIADCVDVTLPMAPRRNLAAYHGGWSMTTWWLPSVQSLAQMTLDAGFGDVRVLGLYRLDMQDGSDPWRAILRAEAE